MNYFLAKSEPKAYSIEQLEHDGTTTWDGVTNPQAVRNIKDMRPNDRVFFYHSGGESAVVGLARVVSEPLPDPKNPKSAIVQIKFMKRFDESVTLTEIKQSGLFADWALVRQGRLSTMHAPEKFVEWMREKFPKAGI
jgi:predicted RNA-binding protein with PUA-like domain